MATPISSPYAVFKPVPLSEYNVEMARSYASLLTRLCEGIPEQTFLDAEMEAMELITTCEKLKRLLDALQKRQEMERCVEAAGKEFKEALPFIEYCMDFYGPNSSLYPMERKGEALRKTHVFEAYTKYRKERPGDWGDGDTVDRERVCAYLIEEGFSF